MAHELKVGQELWYVPSERRGIPRAAVVSKVGRKWAELDGGPRRISLETLDADGGHYSSPGTCYLSKADYDKEVELDAAWARFMELTRYAKRPEGVRLSQVENAARSLFGKSILPQPPTRGEL